MIAVYIYPWTGTADRRDSGSGKDISGYKEGAISILKGEGCLPSRASPESLCWEMHCSTVTIFFNNICIKKINMELDVSVWGLLSGCLHCYACLALRKPLNSQCAVLQFWFTSAFWCCSRSSYLSQSLLGCLYAVYIGRKQAVNKHSHWLLYLTVPVTVYVGQSLF